MMDIVIVKVIVLILLGAVKLGCGLAPLLMVKLLRKEKMVRLEKAMSALLCFGGGVLLATVFVHMLPDVEASLDLIWAGKNGKEPYPFPELILCGGFFTIYFIEAFVHKIFHIHSHSHGFPLMQEEAGTAEIGTQVNSSVSQGTNMTTSYSMRNIAGSIKTAILRESASMTSLHSVQRGTMGTSSLSVSDLEKIEESKLVIQAKEKKLMSSIRSFFIVMALSIHAVFEGMAIGLQQKHGDVWRLFGAVAIHECAILFCVGNEMVSKGLKPCRIVSYMVTLGISTPIGITIGIILTLNVVESGAQALVIGIFQGLAGGTLLYITFFEVFNREKLEAAHMNGLLGWVFIVLGFASMAGLEASGDGD